MAFELKSTSVLEQLLEEINFQRAKEMRNLLKRSGNFYQQGTTYWTDLFVRHFLFEHHQLSTTLKTMDDDDLLFFIRKKIVKTQSNVGAPVPRFTAVPNFKTEVNVYRKDSRKLPIGDPEIDWEETVYLNLIIHQFEYTLTVAICTRTSPKQLQVLRRHSQKVYASPSRRRMDTKGDLEEITFPHICFMIDNFDEVFRDILVRDGEMVCVELLAADRERKIISVIFLGSIRYDALKKVYDSRQSSLSTKVAQKMTFGLFAAAQSQRFEFVRMKGPQGKGHAEMAVTKPKGSGAETPTSEPGFCATDLWSDDDEEEQNGKMNEGSFHPRHQRRLSDPSANLNNFLKGGWRTKLDPGKKSHSEQEGLDSLDQEISEIEAGDLRDGPVRTCCCLLRQNSPIKFDKIVNNIEIADDAIQSEIYGYYNTLPKYRKVPKRITPDGTHIYYWCDQKKELDDGAYNPLWTMRGYTQTFHLWKENKRAQSVPLNAYLTYVTLPWWSIAKDILDHREGPILTF